MVRKSKNERNIRKLDIIHTTHLLYPTWDQNRGYIVYENIYQKLFSNKTCPQ